MQIIQLFKKKTFVFILAKIFFTAGWSKKIDHKKSINKFNQNRNFNFLKRFEIISDALKLIYQKKIFNFDQVLKNHNFKNFLFVIGSKSIKNFKEDFLKEFKKLNEIIYAFNSMNISYIDNYSSLLVENKIQNKNFKTIIIFHCGGRDGLTIENEEYFLDFSFKINVNFKNCNIKHIWLNMPKNPISINEIAEFQFRIMKNIIYINKYKLEDIILCGFSMGGLISLRILEKIKNDIFFVNQKFLSYINIASFFNMIDILKSLKPIKINHLIPCKILNSLGFIISKSFDEEFLSNWSIDFEEIFLQTQSLIENNFICSLCFDEFVPNECSLLNKISKQQNNFQENQYNLDGIQINQINSICFLKIDNKNKYFFDHESCREFFLNFILEKLINSKKNKNFKNNNPLFKLYEDLIKTKYIKSIIKI